MRPRRHVVAAIAATLVVLIVPTGRLSGIANADDKVVLGGGAGITVNGTLCTLATIGHDGRGELVGFTAATCGGPGSQVAAAGGPPVGSVVASDDYLDYAVIKFDPAKVTPTANFAGFAINGIGPADPDFRLAVCTDGAATGNQCGHITTLAGTGRGRNMAGCTFQPGDEGRPVTADNLLIGVARDGWVTHGDPLYGGGGMPESHLTLFSAILADVNAKGGPGAGVSPVPA
jgi:hypothetical protein